MATGLSCPRCDADVSLPEDFAGGYAFCEHCKGRVWVPPAGAARPPQTSSAEGGQTAAPPPATPPGSQAHDTGPPASGPPPSPPQNGNAPGDGNLPAGPAAAPGAKQAPAAPPRSGAVAPVAQPAALQKSSTQTAPAVTGQSSRRHVAKMITADASASRLRIGDSGELPRLKLDEEAETAKRKKSKSPTSQWQWVVLVTVSFSMCALMLLMDTSGVVKSTSEKKQDARARIKLMYLGDDQETPQAYQLYLREAQLARDKKTEHRYYRKVLRLLREEHLNPHYDLTLDDPNNRGITGQRCTPINDNSKPSDEDLERLLLVLLED